MAMGNDTRNRYIERSNNLCSSIMKMFGVELIDGPVAGAELDKVQELFTRWQVVNKAIGDATDVSEISNITQALELSVKNWWKRHQIIDEISGAMEAIEQVSLLDLPEVVLEKEFNGGLKDILQELAQAQAVLMGVYNCACKTNRQAANITVWIELKKRADGLSDIMREISRNGEL